MKICMFLTLSIFFQSLNPSSFIKAWGLGSAFSKLMEIEDLKNFVRKGGGKQNDRAGGGGDLEMGSCHINWGFS